MHFHGPWHMNVLDIRAVHRTPDDIDLAVTMRAFMHELRTAYMKPYLIIYFEHKSILRPSYALIQPAANFNLATVRAHVMESFEPELNYFNNTKVKVPKNKLCNLVNHQCDKNHSQLIRFDRVCAVCIGTTPNGTFVNAMKLLDQTSPAPYHVYDFKDAYLSIFQDYKKTRVAVFGNYEIMR